MRENNINKTTCTKITLVKSLLKTIYQTIMFLANMFKIYQTLPHK